MTPLGIKTGRDLSASIVTKSVGAGATVVIAPGQGDRVALVVSLPAATAAALDGTVAIGFAVAGVFAPLTCLSAGHPVCYLSIDKIGAVLLSEISAENASTGALVLGVTTVRQIKELP